MRRLVVTALVIVIGLAASLGGASAQALEFKLGFKALAEQIPDTVGTPLEAEHYGANGDSLQQTTKGLMAWRKADNWTAYTDGATTWLNGPNGLQSRPNDQRFEWEADYQVMKLQAALPSIIDQSVGWHLKRVGKITTAPTSVSVEWDDGNWTRKNMAQNQWDAITGIADWMNANMTARPSITIRGNSALGVGNSLETTTSGNLLDAIGKRQAGQAEWLAQAKFTVRGELY